MSIHEFWLAGLATTCVTMSAGAADRVLVETNGRIAHETPATEPTRIEEIVAGMRELLDSVRPEIALPAIEIPVPAISTGEG